MQLNDILAFFAKYIEKELGIIYADHNYFQLQNRLDEIAKLQNFDSIETLYANAQKGISGAFRQLLLDLATNNETSFFRDPKIFKAVENFILRSFSEQNRHRDQLKIWSAASSTGQEALTTAIVINEYNAKALNPLKFSILATDISERVLTRAKTAVYSQLEVQRGLPAPYMIKYFKKDEQDRWTASAVLTQNIEYRKQNLKDSFPFHEPFDLIFCRNVLIYQNVDSKKEILDRLTATLRPGGFLILGAGESLIGLSSDYEMQSVEGTVLYRKKNPLAQVA